jgi:hypothetical protein
VSFRKWKTLPGVKVIIADPDTKRQLGESHLGEVIVFILQATFRGVKGVTRLSPISQSASSFVFSLQNTFKEHAL